MTDRTPLDTLVDLAREARNSAAKALADERQTQQQAHAQIKTLENYRLEYARRLQSAMNSGIDPASMQNYQQFLHSLDAAIDRAHQTLAQQRQRVSKSQEQWQQKQRTLSSYDTLISRREAREQWIQHRREMRFNDEMSANMQRRQQGGHQEDSGYGY
ncbi:flagellar export protein FliJ [Aidingimonas halophila]|uniref:Flagellar FliJ protein n=1 Tax=Aidingimonas halophila TaxID=574349 RepID=A0A1H3BA57_9GAMM|nr:flagellar export protein FliJ [Aidingimonas halophila]GHC26153.1 flagellar FliJ protein [Aidingimonas halophila]SDX38675.1 flagellar FliJ protein [Aidingimonas halophila]